MCYTLVKTANVFLSHPLCSPFHLSCGVVCRQLLFLREFGLSLLFKVHRCSTADQQSLSTLERKIKIAILRKGEQTF